MTVVVAEVTRGGVVESVHHGTVAVVGPDDALIASAGDPDQFAYFRSSAKPFQALPLIESGAADRFGFTPAELALCCASHNAEPRHQRQVEAMLAKLGLDPNALRCGIPFPSDEDETARIRTGVVAPSPLQCDCSGKHTGMLAACLHLGYAIDDYLDPEHPLQRQILEIVAEVCAVAPESIRLATDGCSLPTFGASIQAFARSFSVLAAPRVGNRVAESRAAALDRLRGAMIAHPENVAGTGELVTDLMAAGAGAVVAKSGAEGLICVGIPASGQGIAIRIADGTFRTHPEVVIDVLRQLGTVDESILAAVEAKHRPEIRNHNHRHVGDIRSTARLTWA